MSKTKESMQNSSSLTKPTLTLILSCQPKIRLEGVQTYRQYPRQQAFERLLKKAIHILLDSNSPLPNKIHTYMQLIIMNTFIECYDADTICQFGVTIAIIQRKLEGLTNSLQHATLN